jgi:hypothetical protein
VCVCVCVYWRDGGEPLDTLADARESGQACTLHVSLVPLSMQDTLHVCLVPLSKRHVYLADARELN